ncbi:MAG TPA: nucleotide sugar dehydrogenase [Nitrospirae bacterium]|nr:UDP-N-acetyl-D-glucosamine 6-dehydrogenase [bacterium BMS3Abin06]HDH12737.1 nucleotide sugar dehydrogenase [Nitrospirota bacterium]HDZ00046.1 nucleotide sugar dehydrogenase [Nitrospirota bacterium]
MNNYLYDVCIIGGCGHVGLPLGIAFAHAGKRVVLYDIDRNAIDTISRGKMPFIEEGAEEMLRDVLEKNLFLSSEKSVISGSYFIVIVIGTPIDEHLNPRFTLFKEFLSGITEYLIDEQHIILRSTIFPGTTEKIVDFLRSNGRKTRVSFCPERIAEGKAMEELRNLPQIIGSLDDISFQEAKELFVSLTNDIIYLTPKEAELAKLFTNVWRYIRFSISNQFYQIATQYNLDYYRIFDAVTYNYPRTGDLPSAGFAAGPCLFKDTMQLAAYSNNSFFLGHAAMLINEGLPNFIVQRLKEKHSLKDKIVGILGMAFKGDIDDLRESLSYKLKKILEMESKQVLCTDPFVKDANLVTLDEAVNNSDIIILGAPHSQYKEIGIDFSKKLVVDVWNFFGKGGLF